MSLRLLFLRLGIVAGWLAGLAAPASGQTLPAFDLVQRVGQQLNSPVGGPAVTSMVADNWGNVYVAGYFTGTVQLGATQLTTGPNTLDWVKRSFLAKLDAAGNYLWALDFDGDVPAYAGRLLAVDDTGNAYLAGTYTGASASFGPWQLTCATGASSIYVLKLAPDGTFLWVRQAAGSGAGVSGLAVDQAGGVYLTGGFKNSPATFGTLALTNATPGRVSAYVAKLAASGTWQWATRAVGGSFASEPDYGQCLAVDKAGNTYVGGYFGASTLTLGATTLTCANAYGWLGDGFVAQLDPAGQWVWAHRIGGPYYDGVQDLALDASGNVVLTGYVQGPPDSGSWVQAPTSSGAYAVYVARLASTGAVRWAAGAGGPEATLPSQLSLDAGGNAYVTGYFRSATTAFGPATVTNPHGPQNEEAFVAKLDSAGTWQWAQQTLGSYYSQGHGLAADPSGTVWLFGACASPSTTFGSLSFPSQGRFVARLNSAAYPVLVGGVAPSIGAAGQHVTVTGAHFTGVTEVLFNGVPAASFTVLSASKLEAVVPAGATSGRVEVRTAAGGNGQAPVFQVTTALAAGGFRPVSGALWPVPVPATRLLHLQLPAAPLPGQPGRAGLYSVLGAEVRSFVLGEAENELSLRGVASGCYVLLVQVPGQAPSRQQVVLE